MNSNLCVALICSSGLVTLLICLRIVIKQHVVEPLPDVFCIPFGGDPILTTLESCSDQCIIPGVPKKPERRNFITLRVASIKCYIILHHWIKHLPQKRMIPRSLNRSLNLVEWVILILCSFLEMQSFSNFPWFLRPMSEELFIGKTFPKIMVFCGSPLIRVSFVATD